MSQDKDGGSAATPQTYDAMNHGLQRMLDLPTELRCYILELIITDNHFDAYYTLLEHPDIGELVRCNFNAQFRAFKRHRSLASQLQQILTTTALLSTQTNNLRSSRQLSEFLTSNLLHESPRVSVDSSTQAVAVLKKHQTCLGDADVLTDQFVKITIGNIVAHHSTGKQPRFGTNTLSEVEHHRILRAFLRLQLYYEIRKLCGARKSFERKLRSLFSLWTSWEFDEVRSLAAWIQFEYSNLPQHYATSIRALFASVDAHFNNDKAPYIRVRPIPCGDGNRRSKFAKKSKTWTDTPATPHEGRADARNRNWRPRGFSDGPHTYFTQRLYEEHFLVEGYPFWSQYTVPRNGWWNGRCRSPDLSRRSGLLGITLPGFDESSMMFGLCS